MSEHKLAVSFFKLLQTSLNGTNAAAKVPNLKRPKEKRAEERFATGASAHAAAECLGIRDGGPTVPRDGHGRSRDGPAALGKRGVVG